MRDYKQILDALEYWAGDQQVCVDQYNNEIPLNGDRSKGTWKDLWQIEAFYSYDCVVCTDLHREVGIFNFDTNYFRNLGALIMDIWFRKAEKLGFRRDNKSALKLRDLFTGETIFMGWYDGKMSVSRIEPHKFSCCRVFEVKK